MQRLACESTQHLAPDHTPTGGVQSAAVPSTHEMGPSKQHWLPVQLPWFVVQVAFTPSVQTSFGATQHCVPFHSMLGPVQSVASPATQNFLQAPFSQKAPGCARAYDLAMRVLWGAFNDTPDKDARAARSDAITPRRDVKLPASLPPQRSAQARSGA